MRQIINAKSLLSSELNCLELVMKIWLILWACRRQRVAWLFTHLFWHQPEEAQKPRQTLSTSLFAPNQQNLLFYLLWRFRTRLKSRVCAQMKVSPQLLPVRKSPLHDICIRGKGKLSSRATTIGLSHLLMRCKLNDIKYSAFIIAMLWLLIRFHQKFPHTDCGKQIA